MDISLEWLNDNKPGETAKFFDLQFLEKIEDVFKLKVTFPTESANPMNMVQGGMIAAALDDATAMAVISAYEFKKSPLSTDLHVLFHRPVMIGEAFIDVKLIKLGRKIATVEGKLFTPENKLAATLLHTIQPTDIKKSS